VPYVAAFWKIAMLFFIVSGTSVDKNLKKNKCDGSKIPSKFKLLILSNNYVRMTEFPGIAVA